MELAFGSPNLKRITDSEGGGGGGWSGSRPGT